MWLCADNVRGLKLVTEAMESRLAGVGRRALFAGRSRSVSSGGLQASANAGMSSEKGSENLPRRKPKGS
jgi:hypothetical protein